MKKFICVFLLLIEVVAFSFAGKGQLSSIRIYGDGSTYCAFTSLVKVKGKYYLAFREGSTHVSDGDYGVIRILKSSDGEEWNLIQTLTENEADLRDPNLSVMPNGNILLLFGARRKINEGKYNTTSEYSICSGDMFSDPAPVNYPKETRNGWIWKLTWHKGIGYAGCYKGTSIDLVKTLDGFNYDYITTFRLEGKQYETKILFDDNERMMAFVRIEPGLKGMMGESRYPYKDWTWKELDLYLAGQDLIFDGGRLLCVTRTTYNFGSKTNLYIGDTNGNFGWNISLPSTSNMGGDTGYAGIIDNGDSYWISYYSQFRNKKTSVFMAKISKNLF